MSRLADKRVLITGASRGIGRAIAEACAREGAALFLTAREAAHLDATAAALGDGDVRTYGADLADPEALERMFEAAVSWAGRLDVLVNNAGIYIGRPFTEYALAEFDALMKTNVYAVFQLMQLAISHMQEGRGGSIINISSTAGKWESLNQAAYNASKHAVVGLTRCAALENAPFGVRVNAICPGLVETDMLQNFDSHAEALGVPFETFKQGMLQRIPMGRFLQADEVAHIAVYLASDESRTMTGETLSISGGMRMG